MSIDTQFSEKSSQREASSRRRAMARKLQETRDKVSEQNFPKKEFLYDLLQMYARNEIRASIAIASLIVLTGLTISIWSSLGQVLVWISAILTAKGIVLVLCKKFTSLKREEVNCSDYIRKIAAAEFLYGVCWGYLAFLHVDTSEYPIHFFIAGAIIISVAMRMMTASAVIPLAFAGTIPMTLSLLANSIIENNIVYWSLAVSAIIIHLFFTILIRNFHNNILAMLSYRAEKDYLIAELEEAKSFSDEARRKAEEANIAKSRFLATMSHELRTPLNAILGFSEVMKDEIFGAHSNGTYKEYANDIHDSGQHLLNLINEILDLSRIEAGRYELHEESFSLSDIAFDCCRLLRIKADKKDLQIVENYNDQKAKFWADERAIRQIILNLLSNAVKFTPPGGTITVTVVLQENGHLKLSVKDNGPGIPEKEIPVILTNFGQGSLAHETAEGGSGLGLPIVQGLIEMHDGTFRLTSQLRKGTEVTATFPASRVTKVLPQLPIQETGSANKSAKLLSYSQTDKENPEDNTDPRQNTAKASAGNL